MSTVPHSFQGSVGLWLWPHCPNDAECGLSMPLSVLSIVLTLENASSLLCTQCQRLCVAIESEAIIGLYIRGSACKSYQNLLSISSLKLLSKLWWLWHCSKNAGCRRQLILELYSDQTCLSRTDCLNKVCSSNFLCTTYSWQMPDAHCICVQAACCCWYSYACLNNHGIAAPYEQPSLVYQSSSF